VKIDFVPGIGWGSAMGAAEGIVIRTTNPESMASYVAGKVPIADPLPVICIPITSGTGSEVTPFAVFTDPDNENQPGYSNKKMSIFIA